MRSKPFPQLKTNRQIDERLFAVPKLVSFRQRFAHIVATPVHRIHLCCIRILNGFIDKQESIIEINEQQQQQQQHEMMKMKNEATSVHSDRIGKVPSSHYY